MTQYECAILDDYQNVVLQLAEWSSCSPAVTFTVFNRPLGNTNDVAKALNAFQIGKLHVNRAKSGSPSVHPISGTESRALRRLKRESPPSPFVFRVGARCAVHHGGFPQNAGTPR